MTYEQPSSSLQQALDRHGMLVSGTVQRSLDRYCHLLWEWNQKLNLTRHTDYDTFVVRDLLDTVQLSQLIQADEELLDIGSGGGVPGLLLAILRRDVKVVLSESTGKKARVLDSLVESLELPVPVHHGRGEELLDDFRFSSVVARAVGPLRKVLVWVQPHWTSVDRLLLLKGPRWVAERREARELGLLRNLELRRAVTYQVPGNDNESVILQIWKTADAR
jgi:16S rRNA (guanine527-N7)-methyltransferase